MKEKDADIAKNLTWKLDGKTPYGAAVAATSPETHRYWNYWTSLEIANGLLYKRFHKQDGTGSYLRSLYLMYLGKRSCMPCMMDCSLDTYERRKQFVKYYNDIIGLD